MHADSYLCRWKSTAVMTHTGVLRERLLTSDNAAIIPTHVSGRLGYQALANQRMAELACSSWNEHGPPIKPVIDQAGGVVSLSADAFIVNKGKFSSTLPEAELPAGG
jgi:hypothetical protein